MEKKDLQNYINKHPELSLPQIAVKLKISQRTLYRRIEELGIETGRKRGPKKKEIVIPKD